MEAEALGGERSRVDRAHPKRLRIVDTEGLPVMHVKPDHKLRFHPIPKEKYPKGAVGAEVSRHGMDSSHQLTCFISANQLDTEMDVLGEIQFTFVCFLVGQVYEGFEHWKHLVQLLCSASQALVDRPALYRQFLPTLFFQLNQCPQDFFLDIISKDNFLMTTLSNFFWNVDSNEVVDLTLKEKVRKLKNYLSKKYRWSFEVEADQPVIVSVTAD